MKISVKFVLSLLSAFIVGFLSLLGVGAAQAATGAAGSYGPVYGYSYNNWSEVYATTRTYAVATVQTTASSAPAGYMSVNARLFLSNGTMCKETGHIYTSGAAKNFSLGTSSSGCVLPSSYYGWSVTGAWNGSGYSYYYAPKSPWVNGV